MGDALYQYPVRLDAELRDSLKSIAEEQDRPLSRVIREALRRYVENNKEKK